MTFAEPRSITAVAPSALPAVTSQSIAPPTYTKSQRNECDLDSFQKQPSMFGTTYIEVEATVGKLSTTAIRGVAAASCDLGASGLVAVHVSVHDHGFVPFLAQKRAVVEQPLQLQVQASTHGARSSTRMNENVGVA